MASHLIQLEPSLRAPAPRRHGKHHRRADVLVQRGLVIPVLDGFDELPSTARRHVLQQINSAMRSKRPVILASRPDEYREAVETTSGPSLKLDGAAGIELLPVAANRAKKYLTKKQGNWDELNQNLGADNPVGTASSSPLHLFLCRTMYEHRSSTPARSPAELLDEARFPTVETIQSHLFEGFIPAIYRETRAGKQSPWSAATTERALRYLARRRNALAPVVGSGTDLKWLRLHHFTQRGRTLLAWVLTAVVSGPIVVSSVLNPSVIPTALVFTAISAFIVHGSLGQTASPREPTAGLRWYWGWVPVPAVIGAAMGAAMAETHIQVGDLEPGPTPYAVFGCLFAFLGAVVCGWRPRKADRNRPVTPVSLMRQDRRTFLVYVLTWTLLVTSVFFSVAAPAIWHAVLVIGYVDWQELLLAVAQVSLFVTAFAVGVGLIAAFTQTACGFFTVACLRHGFVGRTPFRLLVFLEDAHRRGVLRQVGGSYEFRHIELQLHLAAH